MSETLLGVIIGAVAAILGGIVGQLVRYFLDIKQEQRKAKQETYELIEKLLFYASNNFEISVSKDDFSKFVETSVIKRELYASTAVQSLFDTVLDGSLSRSTLCAEEKAELDQNINSLKQLMRKELGISEN